MLSDVEAILKLYGTLSKGLVEPYCEYDTQLMYVHVTNKFSNGNVTKLG